MTKKTVAFIYAAIALIVGEQLQARGVMLKDGIILEVGYLVFVSGVLAVVAGVWWQVKR